MLGVNAMENKYYLAVEVRPKNYFPINLLDLKISGGFTSTNLEELDAFTLKFTKKQIMDAVKEANLLDVNENMPLVVIYYENKYTRKIEAFTKDYNYDMWKLLNDEYGNKVFLNKIINFLNHKVDKEIVDKLKNVQDKNEFLKILGTLPYFVQRKLYFYLYE